jgi:hypothetical protein
VRGSWWAHPRTHEIYAAYQALTDPERVLRCKLVEGKLTFVERRLWPALLSLATSGEPWQTERLPRAAEQLLERVARGGRIRTDELSPRPPRLADSVTRLERRLLLYTEDLHTERGSHARVLESWEHWARCMAVRPDRPEEAKARLERAARALSPERALPSLPWAPRRSLATRA